MFLNDTLLEFVFVFVQPPVYALEGSVAVAGAALSWMASNLGLVANPAEVEELAAKVENTGIHFISSWPLQVLG